MRYLLKRISCFLSGWKILYILWKSAGVDSRYGLELIAGLFLTVHSNSLLSSIIIAFPNGVFDEKFTYVLLECYLEHIIADHGISVRLLYNKKETNIFTDGIGQSPYIALEKSTQSSMDFVRQFRFDVGKNYYRKLF